MIFAQVPERCADGAMARSRVPDAPTLRPDGSGSGRAKSLDLLPVAAAVVDRRARRHPRILTGQSGRSDGGWRGIWSLDSRPALTDGSPRSWLGDAHAGGFCLAIRATTIDCRTFRVTCARRAGIARPARCLVTLVDQTSELRTEQSLRREMQTDSLTGLPNRAGVQRPARRPVRRRRCRARSHAVLIVDLDRFSRVNACMGALAGDELLISVARRIKGALRADDMLARIGGDEFGIADGARRRPRRRAACRQAHP